MFLLIILAGASKKKKKKKQEKKNAVRWDVHSWPRSFLSSERNKKRKKKKNWRLRKGGGTGDPQRVCAYVRLFRVAARGICRGTAEVSSAEVSSGVARGGQGETDPKPKQHGSEHRQFQSVERKEGKKKK